MKFECPSCNKVMTIKDEFAGKTGKCPGCGQKITLPELDQGEPVESIDPDSEEIMEAESAEFIGESEAEAAPPKPGPSPETASAEAPGPRSFGVKVALVAIFVIAAACAAYFILAPSTIQVPDISLYNVAAEAYVKRSSALTTEAILAWQNTVKKVTGEYLTSKQLFFKLPNLDGLWSDDAFSKTASDQYLSRVAAVPLHALRDWRTVLRRSSEGDVDADLSDTLLRIIEIDRLFTGNEFNTADSDTLIARLDKLSTDDVGRWAEALNAGKGQAALTLACMDALFNNGELVKKRFDKTLKSVKKNP